jgi:hypothetical protein
LFVVGYVTPIPFDHLTPQRRGVALMSQYRARVA